LGRAQQHVKKNMHRLYTPGKTRR